jgi:hypothetical protein
MTKNKDPLDMTTEDRKAIKVEFAPGCFDSFEGSQEELNDLMAEIHRMVETGELFEKGVAVDFDELSEDEDFVKAMSATSKKTLQ